MSVVIALKFNNGVMMASDRQVTSGYGTKIEDQMNKIFRTGSGLIVGGVGSLRELQQMFSISDEVFSCRKATKDGIIECVNKLTINFRKNMFIGMNDIIEELQGRYIVADAYNINVIGQDLSVISDINYYAIGCGDDLVSGHLNVSIKDKDPDKIEQKEAEKILKDCIALACKDSCYIDDNIDILINYKEPEDFIEDSRFEINYYCEYDLINKKKFKTSKVCKHKCEKCGHLMKIVFDNKRKTIMSVYKEE